MTNNMTLNFGGEWDIVITNDVMYQNGWKMIDIFNPIENVKYVKKNSYFKMQAQKNLEKCYIIYQNAFLIKKINFEKLLY
jgi:hypothetical protein